MIFLALRMNRIFCIRMANPTQRHYTLSLSLHHISTLCLLISRGLTYVTREIENAMTEIICHLFRQSTRAAVPNSHSVLLPQTTYVTKSSSLSLCDKHVTVQHNATAHNLFHYFHTLECTHVLVIIFIIPTYIILIP